MVLRACRKTELISAADASIKNGCGCEIKVGWGGRGLGGGSRCAWQKRVTTKRAWKGAHLRDFVTNRNAYSVQTHTQRVWVALHWEVKLLVCGQMTFFTHSGGEPDECTQEVMGKEQTQ